MKNPIDLSQFQENLLALPREYDLALTGGRGGGKSWGMALAILAHVEEYKEAARCLFIRRTFPGIVDFEQTTREVFSKIYGTAAQYNASSHLWRFPNGATLQLDQLDNQADFAKFQGKSYTLICVDEAGQYEDPALIDLLRSCLRAPSPIKPRFIMAANPGGPGHGWLVQRHAFQKPWVPYKDSTGREWITAPSVLTDNSHLDHDSYRQQLAAATRTDEELGRAWIYGDWTVLRGAFFSSVLDQSRVMVDDFEKNEFLSSRDKWRISLAHDFGVSAPAVTLVIAKSPGATLRGKYFPRGSVIVLDESATNAPGQLNTGMGYTVPRLADEIKAMCQAWDIQPYGPADDAIFSRTGMSAGSIAEEFRKNGVHFHKAQKADRRTGWEIMRRMFQDAGELDKPGLYIARRCSYLWQTVPALPRDPRKPDDLDSRAADHGADALRYALTGDNSPLNFNIKFPM